MKEKRDLKKEEKSEKRTFIFLLLLTCVALVGIASLLYWVPYVGFANIYHKLPIIMAIVFASIVIFLIGGGLTLVFTIIRGRNLFFNRRIRGVVIRFLFPLLILVGKLVGKSKDQVRRAFITINNQLVLAEARRVRPEKLLILLPHCLQNHECDVRITGNVENCKACGKCNIKNLVKLSQEYHVSISVATGGSVARRIVVEKKPDMIIGVACERELTTGIQDTYPMPVYGILNDRPFGPCYDTDVDLELVEKGMITFLGYEGRDTKELGPDGVERAVP
ncbi:MAG: DUF116 domain-containing protein [Deltaproteobacteria bacterium]|nr:MAG: DUF116 domain-containing protein [Deltaproteobacteria bacterium]